MDKLIPDEICRNASSVPTEEIISDINTMKREIRELKKLKKTSNFSNLDKEIADYNIDARKDLVKILEYLLKWRKMQPKEKSKHIDEAANSLTGKDRVDTINSQKCVSCDEPNLNFEDELSEKEYTISGMCQSCQNLIFK